MDTVIQVQKINQSQVDKEMDKPEDLSDKGVNIVEKVLNEVNIMLI
jgi:hypothetical protein